MRAKTDSADVPIGVQWYRQLRDVAVVSEPAPYGLAIAAAGAWQSAPSLTSAVIPFAEPSRWTVYGEAWFDATGATGNPIEAALKVAYNLNAAGWTDLVENPHKESHYIDNATPEKRTSISHSWRKAFAFVGPSDTIQFRLNWYISASTANLHYPMFYVDVDKA